MKTKFVLSTVFLSALAFIIAACGTPLTPQTSTPSPAATTIPLPLPSSQPTVTRAPTISTPALQSTATSTVSNQATQISEDQNGQTITVRRGARIQLVLHSTYWELNGSSDAQVLAQVGDPNIVPDLTVKIPGTGAGTITVEFQALQAGRADITASRTICGEALACTPDKKSFQVTVIVT